MTTIFLRSILLYVLMIAAIRALGKRQLSQLQPFEFAMTVAIADLASSPVSDVSIPLLYGVLPIFALIILHAVLTALCLRSDKARSFLSGRPAVLMEHGCINQQELDRQCLSIADLWEGMRCCGILNPADADVIILEDNGALNAFAKKQASPATAGDSGVATGPDGMPRLLIASGRIQAASLQAAALDAERLRQVLEHAHCKPEELLYASLGPSGDITAQTRDGKIVRLLLTSVERQGKR